MRVIIVIVMSFLLIGGLCAEDKKLTYQDHVMPLLREKCASCHNADKKQGGLNVTNFTTLMEGSGRGKVIEPGDPEQSTLYLLMAHKEKPEMPPKSPKLPDKDLELVANWIKAGALESSGSTAQTKKPKVELSLKTAARGKPDGPPPMPPDQLLLETPEKATRGNAITALAVNPWSPVMAVAGPRCVLLFHTQTQELLGVLPIKEGQINVLRFSRNGGLLLAGGGRGGKNGKVTVWDIRTGQIVIEAGDEHDAVLAADISPDQTQIALGGPSKMVRVYSTKDNSLLYEMKKHTDWITALEYSPDGVLLATGDRNGGLAIWETATGREFLTPRGPQSAVTELSWRPDGNLLAAASEDTQIRLFEMENGNQVKGWAAHPGGALSVRYHHDGRIVSSGRDRTTKIWNGDGALQKQLPATTDLALRTAWTFDGSAVVTGDWTGVVKFFTVADGKETAAVASNPPPVAEQLAFAAKKLETAKAKLAQVSVQQATLQSQLQKTAADMATAQKQFQEAAVALKAAQDAATKTAGEPTLTAWRAARAAIGPKELAAARLAESALKAKEAAEKLAGNAELNAFSAQAQALAAKHTAELASARQYAAQLELAAKPMLEKLNAANAQVATAQAAVNSLAQLVPGKQAAAKAAQDQISQTQRSTKAAEEEMQQVAAQIERLQKAMARQKAPQVSQK